MSRYSIQSGEKGVKQHTRELDNDTIRRIAELQEDLNEFKSLLEKQSSYYQVSKINFENYYNKIERKVNQKDSIPVHFLAFELERFISNIIDRHANIRMENFEEDDYELYNLYFPFAVSTLDDKIVALKFNKSTREYEYYSQKYPFIKKVNK